MLLSPLECILSPHGAYAPDELIPMLCLQFLHVPAGYHRTGYHKDGYDKDGFDKYGYNKKGYDKNGRCQCVLTSAYNMLHM